MQRLRNGLCERFTFVTALLICCAAHSAPPSEGRIAWLQGDAATSTQVVVHDLATARTAPVGPGAQDGPPVWSPDGARLAFATNTADGRYIHVVDSDGSAGLTVPSPVAWNDSPRWSDEGDRLAFVGGDDPLMTTVYVYDFGDGETSQWGSGRQGLRSPVWLAGDVVRFVVYAVQQDDWEDDSIDIGSFVFDAGGKGIMMAVAFEPGANGMTSKLVLVTSKWCLPLPGEAMPSAGEYLEWAPAPSPNGRMLAFESNDGGDREIFMVTLNKPVFDVTNHREADWNPVWAPNSDALAFESFRGGRRGVYRVYPDTVRVSPIAVTNDGDNWSPSWGPEGEWVVFVSNRDGDDEIYLAHADNGETVRLSEHAGPDWAPAWQPEHRE